MELRLFRDTLQRTENVCSQKYEQSLEAELLIPEYLAPVFKIVKTIVQPTILQKRITGNRCQIEGYFRLTVFYQGDEDAGLCAMEQKVSFQRALELKEGAYHSHFCVVGGEAGYMNCRAVNPRRIEARGVYNMEVRVYAQNGQDIVTAVAGEGICQKTAALEHTALTGLGEKQFTLEEECAFPAAPAAVLWTRCAAVVTEAKAVSGKAVVKGEARADIVFRAEREEEPRTFTATLPFSQIVDAPGLTESCHIAADADVTGCAVAAEGTAVTLTMSCALSLRHRRDVCQYIVADAFSKTHETTARHDDVWADAPPAPFVNTLEVQIGGTLPEENAQILLCVVEARMPELARDDGGAYVQGRLAAHLICRNALGELECFDKTGEYTLPGRYTAKEGAFLLADARVISATARKTGAEASVTVTLTLRGEVWGWVGLRAMTELEEGEALSTGGGDGAIVVYYAQKGEDIFYIAKHYHADPADIASLAALSGDTVETDCRLLIPAAE